MDKSQHIERIREAVIKANPEIVELKFGCQFRMLPEYEEPLTFLHEDNWYRYYMFSDGSMGDEDTLDMQKYETVIIGRPIRLADILLAIGKPLSPEYPLNAQIDDIANVVFNWDKKHDSLDMQSDETLQFISNLLS